MFLYHGSNVEVKEPKIIKSKRLLDFGTAFYLTSDFEQAKKQAIRTTERREVGVPTISVLSINENEIEKLHSLTFDRADKEWLRYISLNRTEKSAGDSYDLVVGPVANDQAIRKTEKSLSILEFREAKFV